MSLDLLNEGLMALRFKEHKASPRSLAYRKTCTVESAESILIKNYATPRIERIVIVRACPAKMKLASLCDEIFPYWAKVSYAAGIYSERDLTGFGS